MQSDFAPTTNKSLHVGAKRAFTTISWDQWHQRYTPEFVRCIVYKNINGVMQDIHERSFHKTSKYADSVVSLQQTGYSIILLEWRDHDLDAKANSFLNNFIPIDKNQRFHDGIVGIGIGRWLKTLFMTIIIKTGAEREQLIAWFHDLVRFSTGLLGRNEAGKWFDVIRMTLQTNDSVEDILVLRLLQAVLGVTVARQKMFRWFETSIQRAYKHNTHLRDGMLTPMVWLYTHLLLDKDLPNNEALAQTFERLMGLSSYSDVEMMRFLLGEMFPEVISKTEDILKAIRSKTPWSDTIDTVFGDGSIIPRTITEMPYGIRMLKGTIAIAPDRGDTFILSTAEYNHYTPFMIRLPEKGTEYRFTLFGKIVPPDMTSRYGPGVVCRSLKEYAKNGKDFMGIMGLSLAGGRGNGRTAPTNERAKPSFLIHPPAASSDDMELEIATIRVTSTQYSLMTIGWTTPLTMDVGTTDTVFAVFLKGFRESKIRIQPSVSIPAPPTPTPAAPVVPAQIISTAGVRFSDLVRRAKMTV